MAARLLLGHVIDQLRLLPERSVHTCWTSPPYYGLRSYGTEPQVWAPPKVRKKPCAHTFGGAFCDRCGAWRGEHGLEPSFDMWLRHEVMIFREVHRVLRDDGTLWLNIGDAYASTVNGRSAADAAALGDDDRAFRDKPVSTVGGAFKLKDRLMMPARLAIALQEDGWYLRDEIVLHKLNPMPSSAKDRTCPAHEMLYLLSKSRRYYYDYAAIVEPFSIPTWDDGSRVFGGANKHGANVEHGNRTTGRPASPAAAGGRVKRSVWSMSLEPFKEAHFATAPTGWVRPCVLAGSAVKVCAGCAAPWERIVATAYVDSPIHSPGKIIAAHQVDAGNKWAGYPHVLAERTTIGFRPTCRCYDKDYMRFPEARSARKRIRRIQWPGGWWDRVRRRPGLKEWPSKPATVLDPFGGAGTTALVADETGRDAIIIELNPTYAKLARKRLREALGRVKSDLAEDAPGDMPLFGGSK